MIIKKLAVPFINEKLLQQAEHCYIATNQLSEAGFDFIRSRIPTKCKINIVTGLELPTAPEVLRRIWRNYQGRITLNIYTKNIFHANLFMFDLPFRKAVAFIGSGACTLEGIKDQEELFYKITDLKEIENLKSWFTGYFEFSESLTEELIQEYEHLYPYLKQREIKSRQEKKEFISITTGGFKWDRVAFKNQFFAKEDYLTISTTHARETTPEINAARARLCEKLMELHEALKPHIQSLKLSADPDRVCCSLQPIDHADGQIRSLWLAYGRHENELKKHTPPLLRIDTIDLRVIIQQKEVGIWLTGMAECGRVDRDSFKTNMNTVEYRQQFFALLKGLGAGYWIEVAGDRKAADVFTNEEALWEFTKADQWRYYAFIIGRNYVVGSNELNKELIAETISKEMNKLVLLYRHLIKHN